MKRVMYAVLIMAVAFSLVLSANAAEELPLVLPGQPVPPPPPKEEKKKEEKKPEKKDESKKKEQTKQPTPQEPPMVLPIAPVPPAPQPTLTPPPKQPEPPAPEQKPALIPPPKPPAAKQPQTPPPPPKPPAKPVPPAEPKVVPPPPAPPAPEQKPALIPPPKPPVPPAPKTQPKPQPPKPQPKPVPQPPKPQPKEPSPPPAQQPQGFSVSDTEFPAPEVPQKIEETPLDLKFKYRGEIRTRLGIDTIEEYARFVDITKKADDPSRYFYRGCEDVVDWRSSLFFSSQLEFTQKIWARLELYMEYAVLEHRNEDGTTILVNGDHPRSYFDWRIGEAFLAVDDIAPGLSIKAGNQVVNLGMLDAHSVLEKMSPADLNALYWSDFTTPRLPIWALRLDYNYEWFTGSLIWQPVFTAPPLDLYGGDWSLLRPGVPDPRYPQPFPNLYTFFDASKEHSGDQAFLTSEDPMPWPQNSAIGLKLGGSASGFDFAAIYTFAYEETPRISYDPVIERIFASAADGKYSTALQYVDSIRQSLASGDDMSDIISSKYVRTHTLGAEASYGFWELSFKGELAFEFDKTYYAFDYRGVGHDTLSYALGVDWTHDEDTLYVALELFGSYLFGMEDGEKLLFATQGNLGLWGIVRAKLLDKKLILELVSEGRFNTKEMAIVPQIGYEVVDNLRIFIGAMILESFIHEEAGFSNIGMSNDDRKDTYMGRYSNNDQVFILLKYSY